MKFKIIDKCCNIFTEIELKPVDLLTILKNNLAIEIAPAKVGHSIVINPDKSIEYVPIKPQCSPEDKHE